MRPVVVLATGGTIAMAGEGPVAPALGAGALGRLAGVEVRELMSVPSVHLTPALALSIARAAVEEARRGRGVVVTHGTDTLEETAFLTDLLHDAEAPVVFTGAMRPASAAGADGPANLAEAVAVAGSPEAAGLGALVAFAGEVHAAREVRKADSLSPRAFASPRTGPLGRVAEGRIRLERRLDRRPAMHPERLDFDVPVVGAHLGSDGRDVREADGLVAVVLGAGHTPPPFLAALRRLACPVAVTVRPERGAILRGTYGFDGSELGLAGLVRAGALSPQAARIKLMACLGARADVATAFAPDDG